MKNDFDSSTKETKDGKKEKQDNPYKYPTIPALVILSAFAQNFLGERGITLLQFLEASAGIFLIFFFLYTFSYVVLNMVKEKVENEKFPSVRGLYYAASIAAIIIALLCIMSYGGCGAVEVL